MKKIFSGFILIVNILTIKSQTISTFAPKIENIPSSPEAALFQRFGDIPVGHYTGTANISIPIYTIKEAGIEIPIELRYNASGVKVSDEATWVGLGWDLSPGGSIIQEVRGKRDDEDPFYYPQKPTGYDYLKNKILMNGPIGFYKLMWRPCGAQADELPFSQYFQETPYSSADELLRYKMREGGGQPDIYNFNFAGHSGKFYINFETYQIEQIDKKEEIFFERNGYNSFTATTQDGNVFHFNLVENASNFNSSVDVEVKSGRTFKLSSINLNNGNQIHFTYSTVSVLTKSYNERKYIVENCQFENSNLGLKEIFIESSSKILTQISTRDAVINFVLEDREDLMGSPTSNELTPKRLKQIDIYAKYNYPLVNEKIRTFLFNYTYFPYNSSLGIPNITNQPINNIESLGKRLKLDSVKEIGYINEEADFSKPAYKFEYDMSITLPLKISCSKDFWGYFNGAENSSLLPNLEYFDFEYDIDYMQNYYYDDNGVLRMISHHLPFEYINYNSVDRFTNTNKIGAYMLNKIIYPTGGFTKFEYESNTFNNQFIPDKSKIEIARKRVTLENRGQGNPQVNYSKSFVINKSTTVVFNNSIADGYTPYNNANAPTYSHNAFNGSKIVFSKKRFINGQLQTTIIKEWKVNDLLTVNFENNHGHNWNEKIRVEFDPDQSVYYVVEVVNTLNYLQNDTYHIAGLKSDFYFFDNTGVNTTISYGGGLRIKSIKNYSEKGVLISNKKLNYFGGILLNRFKPLTSKDAYCATTPPAFSNGQPVTNTSVKNTIYINSDTIIQSGSGILGYSTVEEIDLSNIGSTSNGKKVYKFKNFENLNYKDAPTIVNALNGLPYSEVGYDANGAIKYMKSYDYEDLYALQDKYFYATIYIHLLSGFSTYCDNDTGAVRDYMLISYPIISTWYKLKNSSTKNHFGNNFLSQTERYTYNTLGNIKTKTISSSNNEELITEYYYPTDTPVSINQSMIDYHMTGVVLTKKEFRGGELLSTYRTEYDSFGGLLMPKYISASKGNDPTERKITFDSYDENGNVLQYTMENGVPVSLKWDNMKSLLIARAENATYSQADSVGFLPGNLPNAMVTRYESKKLIGVTKITDPKGLSISYEYDAFGRLKTVKDNNQNINSEYEYNFLQQN